MEKFICVLFPINQKWFLEVKSIEEYSMLLTENYFRFSSYFKTSQQQHPYERGYFKKLAAVFLPADTSSQSSLYGTVTPRNTAPHFQNLENKMSLILPPYRQSIRMEGPFSTNDSIPFPVVRYTLASIKENHLKAKCVISKIGRAHV